MLTASDYMQMWESCTLTNDPNQTKQLNGVCNVAFKNYDNYQAVQLGTKDLYGISIPWPIIAAIHFRESNQSLNCHLHNGDPLTARTVHVPVGRPILGNAPFTWIQSAIDAFKDVVKPLVWDIPSCLLFMERYNGLGYQKHGVNSPYIWNFTSLYKSGLFVSDGTLDMTKKESRPGCVAILKMLSMKGVSIDFTTLGTGVNPIVH